MAGTSLARCLIRCPSIVVVSSLPNQDSPCLYSDMDPQSTLRADPADSELGVPVEKAAVTPEAGAVQSDPFGDESDASVKYRTMAWW
jgi:hypothetical protein